VVRTKASALQKPGDFLVLHKLRDRFRRTWQNSGYPRPVMDERNFVGNHEVPAGDRLLDSPCRAAGISHLGGYHCRLTAWTEELFGNYERVYRGRMTLTVSFTSKCCPRGWVRDGRRHVKDDVAIFVPERFPLQRSECDRHRASTCTNIDRALCHVLLFVPSI
jgi:hypothetical protein